MLVLVFVLKERTLYWPGKDYFWRFVSVFFLIFPVLLKFLTPVYIGFLKIVIKTHKIYYLICLKLYSKEILFS